MSIAIIGDYNRITHIENTKCFIRSKYFEFGEKYFSINKQINLENLYYAVLYGKRKFQYRNNLITRSGEFSKLTEETIITDLQNERDFLWALSILKRNHFPSDFLANSNNKKIKTTLTQNPKQYVNSRVLFLKSFLPFVDFFNFELIESYSSTSEQRNEIINTILSYQKLLKKSELNFFQVPNKYFNLDDSRESGLVILKNIVFYKVADLSPSIEYNKSLDRDRKKKFKKKPNEKTKIDNYAYKYKKRKKRGKNNLKTKKIL